jgi:hypothetical protein
MRVTSVGVVFGLIACGGSSSSTPQDASMDRTPCEAAYQATIDRTCTVPADCTLVDHDDCCGIVRTGVRAGTEQDAAAAEATYAACFSCGARGCQHADLAEDGHTPGAGEAIVATCVAERCTSIVQ